MTTKPGVINRDEQPYVAIRKQVAMQDIPTELPPLIGEVFGWLEKKGAAPVGAPFFRYFSMDPNGNIDVDVGVPTATALQGDERVHAGSFAAGRYAVLIIRALIPDFVRHTVSFWTGLRRTAWPGRHRRTGLGALASSLISPIRMWSPTPKNGRPR